MTFPDAAVRVLQLLGTEASSDQIAEEAERRGLLSVVGSQPAATMAIILRREAAKADGRIVQLGPRFTLRSLAGAKARTTAKAQRRRRTRPDR